MYVHYNVRMLIIDVQQRNAMPLNRDDPTPLYYQLRTIIKESLDNNDLKPGDAIPTEQELEEKYSVSRATVRKAIDGLVAEGYLRRERAKGTFAQYPPPESKFLGNLRCFSEEMLRSGTPHSTIVLDQAIENNLSYINEKLLLEENKSVFRLKRLRKVEDKPILIVESYLPYDLFPGIEAFDFNDTSLYDLLETKYNMQLNHVTRIIESKIVDSEETMHYLQLPKDACISYIESLIYDRSNRPIEFLKADMIGRIEINIR